MNIDLKHYEVWFITGSQHLYGKETLQKVSYHAEKIAHGLDNELNTTIKIKFKPIVKTSEEITSVLRAASNDNKCIGCILWMHTFSPAKMWISGLQSLSTPFVHFHTQFNRDIPWDQIDMDFMNLNQSAHGGREFGFMVSRMRKSRTVIVGHWQDKEVQNSLLQWIRVAAGLADSTQMKIARFGDNMRQVAVTEGDKVQAQLTFGYSVNGYGIGDLLSYINDISENQIKSLLQEYQETYKITEPMENGTFFYNSLFESARIELGMKAFLKDGDFSAFTTTFENLHGMQQLPGLAVQRLMADGYGFGAEGDWKTAALTRTMKVMSSGLSGGTSFMEDYTYHLEPGNQKVLGAHMLEVCPSIASETPSLEVHPLGIGGKEAPGRLVFNADTGPALNASLIDMGNRFRLIVNEVEAVRPDQDLPHLPVARVMWKPLPDLSTAAAAWIYAGGAHHTVYSRSVKTEDLEIFAEMTGIELLVIDNITKIRDFRNQLRWNEAVY